MYTRQQKLQLTYVARHKMDCHVDRRSRRCVYPGEHVRNFPCHARAAAFNDTRGVTVRFSTDCGKQPSFISLRNRTGALFCAEHRGKQHCLDPRRTCRYPDCFKVCQARQLTNKSRQNDYIRHCVMSTAERFFLKCHVEFMLNSNTPHKRVHRLMSLDTDNRPMFVCSKGLLVTTWAQVLA